MCSNPSIMKKTDFNNTHYFVANNITRITITWKIKEWYNRKNIAHGVRIPNPNPGSIIHYLVSIKIPYFSTPCAFR